MKKSYFIFLVLLLLCSLSQAQNSTMSEEYLLMLADDSLYTTSEDSVDLVTYSLDQNISLQPDPLWYSTALTFTDGGEALLTISWKDSISITYKGSITEGTEVFFDFLKSYIKGNYVIIPRSCLE